MRLGGGVARRSAKMRPDRAEMSKSRIDVIFHCPPKCYACRMNKLLILLVLLSGFAAPLRAANTDYGTVQVLNGWQMPDGTHQAALVFDLNPGWKTYWRSPGPNGIPPQFNWLGSRNLAGVAISWPVPHMVGPAGAQALGYTDKVVIPIRFQPAAEGPISVALYLEFGVCSDICIPASLSLLARLDPESSDGRELIEAALQDVPHVGGSADMAGYSCSILPSAQGYDVATQLQLRQADEAAIVAIEYDNPESWVEPSATVANGPMLSSGGKIRFFAAGGMVERDRLRVTVLTQGGAFELHGCPAG